MAVIAEHDGVFGTEAPLDAHGYTGDGIVVTPAGRVAYWTGRGLVVAAAARAKLETAGRVTTYRLDAGVPGVTWGRLFVDACVPAGASLRVQTVTADEDRPDADALPWAPPPGSDTSLLDPSVTPPQLPVADDALLRSLVPGPVHRRDRGPELPWVAADPGGFRTYEAPVLAAPGRFLWVRLVLAGTGRVTPRVGVLRAERPGHDLLRQLPRSWSRDEGAAAFLRRYLAPLDGELHSLGALAAARHLLVDPRTTPEDALEWLAGFVGLTLDRRVPVERRRLLVAEAAELFARRGTVRGLRRMIELAIGTDVILVERFRLRGLSPDSFERTAHRFTVIVPGVLDGDQRGVLDTLLDGHRPAHTVVDVCTAAGGSRVGLGLHLGLSSVVGPTGGFTPLVVGSGAVGRDRTIASPPTGLRPGGATLGADRLGWGR